LTFRGRQGHTFWVSFERNQHLFLDRLSLRFLVHVFLAAFALGGCGRKTPPSTVGSEVQALRADGTLASARIVELYGKLARVSFEDKTEAWQLAVELEPPATPASTPEDPCSVAPDDRIRAPWTLTNTMYAGRVRETHGRIAEVQFDDGDRTWVPCDAIQPIESPSR